MSSLGILSLWGEIFMSLASLEVENQEESKKNYTYRHWGAAPTKPLNKESLRQDLAPRV